MANEHARRIAEARAAAGIDSEGKTRQSRQGEQTPTGPNAIRAPQGRSANYDPEDEMSDLLEPLELPKTKPLSKAKMLLKALKLGNQIRKGNVTMFKGSWKTNIAGIIAAVGAIAVGASALLDGDPATKMDMESVMAAATLLGVSFGLMSARDDKVTSKDAGAIDASKLAQDDAAKAAIDATNK